MLDVIIKTNRANEGVFSEFLDTNPETSDLFDSAGFDGSEELIQFFAQVVLPAIPSVALIIQTLINSKKRFSLQLKGKDGEEFSYEYEGNNPKKAAEEMLNALNNNPLGKDIVSHFYSNQMPETKGAESVTSEEK